MRSRFHLARVRTVALLAAALTALGLGFGTSASAAAPAHAAPASAPAASTALGTGVTTSYTFRAMDDGVKLGAFVVRPATCAGPCPVLVAPSSWAVNGVEYLGAAKRLAAAGYLVVSYTTRGFWESGGTIALGGPRDVADARQMIDWAVTDLGGDPQRVGMFGISYGAGLSLLTASQDARVRAVVSMSAWTDMDRSLVPHDTIASGTIAVLLGSGLLTGRLDAPTKAIIGDWLRGNAAPLRAAVAHSSPVTLIDQLNAKGTPVMIANAWGDSFFPPGQVVDYYERLTVPKRLQLVPGIHASSEMVGAAGIPNTTWTDATRWFDHHLRGAANGVDAEQPVRLVPQGTGPAITAPRASSYRTFDDVASVTTSVERSYLTASGTRWTPGRTGGLGATPSSGWGWTLNGAVPTVADSHLDAALGLVPRTAGAVFWTEKTKASTFLGGTPTARFTITSTGDRATVNALLYEVRPFGLARALSFQPVSVTAAPGTPTTVEVELEPVFAQIGAGSRIALVLDTSDATYSTTSRLGDKVTITSPAGAPSYLDVPYSG